MIREDLDPRREAGQGEEDEPERSWVIADALGPAMAELGGMAPGPRAFVMPMRLANLIHEVRLERRQPLGILRSGGKERVDAPAK